MKIPKRSLFVGNLGDMTGVDGRKVGRNGRLNLFEELIWYGLKDKQKNVLSLIFSFIFQIKTEI